jgi:hypothetical protein
VNYYGVGPFLEEVNDQTAYNKVQALKQICLQSKSKEEARAKALSEYPNLGEVQQMLKAYQELR